MQAWKNSYVDHPAGVTDYIRFGSGERTLVMIPGLGDGLATVRGKALPFSLLYRSLARDFTVYVFSRRRELVPGMTTRDMAEDLYCAMDALCIRNAAVLGVSQGGMIAQWLCLDHPEAVRRLVLAVTAARPNPTLEEVVTGWLEMARRGDFKAIMEDAAEKSYSEKRLRSARTENALAALLTRPRSLERFTVQAQSCLSHDAFDLLGGIACPTLIIGGREDKIVTGQASREMALRIDGSQIYMYDGLGHGLYEEAPDFLGRVSDFCKR